MKDPGELETDDASPRGQGAIGTGLSWSDLAILMAASVLAFVVYPSPLWSTEPGSSHVLRFAVSYLGVIPLAAAMQYYRGRAFDLKGLTAAVLIVWATKMLVTVGVWDRMAKSVRAPLEPPAPAHLVRADHTEYQAVAGFSGRRLSGRVVDAEGRPLAGALVSLGGVSTGKPFPPDVLSAKSVLSIGPTRFEPRVVVVAAGAKLALRNDDAKSAVLRGTEHGRTVNNVPLVADGPERVLKPSSPGLIRFVRTDQPETAPGWVWVVGTPYYAVTDERGGFVLEHAPEGNIVVTVDHLPEGAVDATTVETPISEPGDQDVRISLTRSRD